MKQAKVDEATLRKFADNGKSLAEAASHFGLEYQAMFYWCKKYGVNFRGNAKRQPAPKKAPEPKKPPEPTRAPSGKLADLYRQVVEVRQHMRRLAYRERQLLDAIGKEMDGNV